MNESKSSGPSSSTVTRADPVLRATELTPLIRSYADENERGRQLATPVVEALRGAGLFTMGLPASLGGTKLQCRKRCAQ